jgi:hypothetical protein
MCLAVFILLLDENNYFCHSRTERRDFEKTKGREGET